MLHPPIQSGSPRRADWAVGAIALLHCVLAVMFLFVLAIAVDRARAQVPIDETVCTGDNLLERMATEEPDSLAKIHRDADAIPNGKGLLWRIESDGAAPSWLYGTMHMSDPRILAMEDNARTAFEGAETVVLELEDLEDLAKVRAEMMTNPALTMLSPGTTLQSLMTEEELAAVDAALKERGIPLSLMSRMQPWLIFTMLVIPECETVRRMNGHQPLDARLASEAHAMGKQLQGLETLEEQLSVFGELPLELQVRMLVDIASFEISTEDRIETMTELYLNGETGLIMSAMLINARPAGIAETSAYLEFEENLIGDRNVRMADRLQPMLAQGGAFIAVGALHLPGENGLVQLLRDKGYRVTAVE